MENRILMIVWNGIQNDSRVQKSAKSLSDAGYLVSLIGIATKGEPRNGSFDGIDYELVQLLASASRNSGLNSGEKKDGFDLSQIFFRLQRAGLRMGQKSKLVKSILGRIALEKYSAIAAHQILEMTTQKDFQFIHVHDYTALPLAGKLLATQKFAKVKVVYDAHEYLRGTVQPVGLRKYFLNAEKLVISKSVGVITVCEPIGNQLLQDFPEIQNLTIVRNTPVKYPIDESWKTIRELVRIDTQTPLVVYSGGTSRLRGLELFIKAIEKLPEFHAVVVAPKPDSLDEYFPKDSDELRKRIHVLPFVPQEQVSFYLSSADVAVHPILSTDKGKRIINHEWALPNKWFEYIQAGLPVVVSDVELMGKLVKEIGNGMTFKSGDAVDFAQKIFTVYKDRDVFRRAITVELVNDSFWSVDAGALAGLYKKIS